MIDPRSRLPLLVVAIVLVAWYFRFDIVVPGNREATVFFKVNRWTGGVELCGPGGCREVAQK